MTNYQLRWEDAAETATVTGWACKRCRKFWGDGAAGERAARYCCSTDAPCECGGRREKHYTHCKSCRDKHDNEKYWEMEEVEWDGETPLCEWRGDRFSFNAGELTDHLMELDIDYIFERPALVEEWEPSENQRLNVAVDFVQLVLCCEQPLREFDLLDHYYDIFDGDDPPFSELDSEGIAAEAAVNAWLAKQSKLWYPTNKRPSVASLKKAMGVT